MYMLGDLKEGTPGPARIDEESSGERRHTDTLLNQAGTLIHVKPTSSIHAATESMSHQY